MGFSVEEALKAADEGFLQAKLEDVRAAIAGGGDDHRLQVMRARLKAAEGDPQAATAQLQMLAKKHAKDPLVQGYLGALMVGQHRYKDAKKPLEAARDAGADYPAFHHAYGVMLASSGQFREAVLHLGQAGEAWPTSAPTFFYLGISLMELGELGRAEKSLRATTQIEPRYLDAWDALATCLERQGKLSSALAVLDDAGVENPDAPALARSRVGLLARAGRHDEARRALDAIPPEARNAEDLVNLAMLVLETDAAGAVKHAKEATEKAPKLSRAHYVLGIALEGVDDLPGARAALEKAVQLGDPDGNAGTRLGFLLTADGQPEKAVKTLDAALRRNDNAPGTQLNLALAHAKMERKDKALQLATAIVADPRSSASVREQAERLEKALRA